MATTFLPAWGRSSIRGGLVEGVLARAQEGRNVTYSQATATNRRKARQAGLRAVQRAPPQDSGNVRQLWEAQSTGNFADVFNPRGV